MGFGTVMANPITWIVTTFFLIAVLIIMIIFLIILGKKTHALVEFKAWVKGIPIHMFFLENRYVEWKPIQPEAGIVTDKHYGSFIINDKATYIDKRTKNVIIPYDAQFGASINMHAAKLSDDLQYVAKDEESLKELRYMISSNMIPDEMAKEWNINSLKTSINIGAIKSMMTALTPHNIESKIQMKISQALANLGKADWKQFLFPFAGVLFAIIIGFMIIKMAV